MSRRLRLLTQFRQLLGAGCLRSAVEAHQGELGQAGEDLDVVNTQHGSEGFMASVEFSACVMIARTAEKLAATRSWNSGIPGSAHCRSNLGRHLSQI